MQSAAASKDQTAWVQWMRARWFVVTLLLALASALVPALLPSGPPMSRQHGSAFDPGTSIVTLRVRSQAERLLAPPPADPREDARTPQMPPALVAAHPPATAHNIQSGPIAFPPALSGPPAGPRRTGIALPRAPPVLS